MLKHTVSADKKVHYLPVKKQPAAVLFAKGCWYGFRVCLANIGHYAVMTVLLLALKFRNAALVLGSAYCLNFFFSHKYHLWVNNDFYAGWVLLGCIGLLMCSKLADAVEAAKPFHYLLKLGIKGQRFDQPQVFEAANDDVLKHD
ncbi:hypothetical protein [Candidatus Pantoea soli]|uniref:Uncharacterized protein n=1 Tax=Candidatus Pantoea soli TaxID=3098669 RepID=A0A518XK53_9GAMM|nr:hypothetical protein [Pantoea soli]QDY44496.1 hypothetical protein D8B20_21460 [Pantoea soli]